MSKIIELNIKLGVKQWNYDEFKKIHPKNVNISLSPADISVQSIKDARLPEGTVLDYSIDDDGMFNLILKDVPELINSTYHNMDDAVLCCGNITRKVFNSEDVEDYELFAGNGFFLYWGYKADCGKDFVEPTFEVHEIH